MNFSGDAVLTRICYRTKKGAANAVDAAKEGAKAYIGEGKPERKLKPEQALATVLWAGMDSQYFSALMIPDPELAATYKLTETPQANAGTDISVTAPTDTASLVLRSFYLQPQGERKAYFPAIRRTEGRYNPKGY